MKRFTVLLILFMLAGTAQAQTPEAIGKAIMQSFKEGNGNFVRHFITDSAMEVLKRDDLEEWQRMIDAGETSWAKISSTMGVKSASTKADFLKAFVNILKAHEVNEWRKLLAEYGSCYQQKVDTLKVKVVVQDSSENEYKFLAISEGTEKLAISFWTSRIGGNHFLTEAMTRIYIPDEKGEYKCFITCKNGKETMRLCETKTLVD
jgi:hypothetical protein